jgi:ketosteroid isomerase-like protein
VGVLDAITFLQLLVVITVVIAAAMMARTYFRTDTEQTELWKKSAENQNDTLNKVLKDKDMAAFREMLDPDATRFYAKLPYRADGAKAVSEMMRGQLENNEGPPDPMMYKKVQSYLNCVIISYAFLTKVKKDGKDVEVNGKATRVWSRGKGGRWFLAHEHVSYNNN